MNAIVQFIIKHGYSILFAVVFAHQLGFPAPGPLFLLAAGALAAVGNLRLSAAVILSVIACVLADWAWYEAGRRGGHKVLHFIGRLAPDPKAADQKAKKIFAHYGPRILALAKFVPGLDAIAPPLCGTSGTSRVRFLAFDALGALLYSVAYAGLGYVFRHNLERAAVYAGRAGTILAVLVFAGAAIYAIRNLARQRRFARKSRVVRIAPADRMNSTSALATSPTIIEGVNHGN
jgi:membrane protein DedA with SNARE-associated domain